MDKNREVEIIIKNTIFRSISFGTAPYSIFSIPMNMELKRDLNIISDDFTDLITISIWKDFSDSELEDHIKLSQEYLSIISSSKRKEFLDFRIKDIIKYTTMNEWKKRQAAFALGTLLNSCKSYGFGIKLIDLENFDDLTSIKKIVPEDLELTYIIVV